MEQISTLCWDLQRGTGRSMEESGGLSSCQGLSHLLSIVACRQGFSSRFTWIPRQLWILL